MFPFDLVRTCLNILHKILPHGLHIRLHPRKNQHMNIITHTHIHKNPLDAHHTHIHLYILIQPYVRRYLCAGSSLAQFFL